MGACKGEVKSSVIVLGSIMQGLAGIRVMIAVPIMGCFAHQVFELKIDWKELNQFESTDSGQNGGH